MKFDLEYLRDNGRFGGWERLVERDCTLVKVHPDHRCGEPGYYQVRDANGTGLGYGDDEKDALSSAKRILTDRRRKADGLMTNREFLTWKWECQRFREAMRVCI